jgi:hypothetical protein
MTSSTTGTCEALNAAGTACRAPVMRGSRYCCAHDPELPAARRFGSHEQALAAGRLGGRPRKHQQLMLPIDTPDGPATDPRAVLARAAWLHRLHRGVASLDASGRVAYAEAVEHLIAAYRVRDEAALDENDEQLEAEARRRIPGFIDAIGEVTGAGPWPR